MTTSALSPVRRLTAPLISVFLAVLLIAACSSGNSELSDQDARSGTQEGAAEAEDAPEDGEVEEGSEAEEGGEEEGLVDEEVELDERDLIHSATMTVRVDDVDEASDQAKELTGDAGGYVSEEEAYTPTGGSDETSLTLRIPSDEYEGSLTGLADLGDRSSLSRSVEDVTEEMADTESRIESAEAALDTLRGYLEEADDVDDLLRVESEIQDRQSELESFQARLESLTDQTTYSTVELTLQPVDAPREEIDDESLGFLDGLQNGWYALTVFGQGLAAVVGWLLPFAVVLAVVAVGPLLWLRSRGRSLPKLRLRQRLTRSGHPNSGTGSKDAERPQKARTGAAPKGAGEQRESEGPAVPESGPGTEDQARAAGDSADPGASEDTGDR